MSKLNKFLGQPQEIEIKGETLKIYPLKVKDLALFSKENMTDEEKMKLARDIIKKSLKDEEATDEEIGNMDTQAFIKLMDAINKLNGFEDEGLTKIKARIAQARTK